jgi:hypothetical protein
LKSLLIAVLLLVIILMAPAPGFGYSSTIAQKTTDVKSDNAGMMQVGMHPATEITLAGATTLAAGVLAGGTTYFIIAVPIASLRSTTASIGGDIVCKQITAFPDFYQGLMLRYPGTDGAVFVGIIDGALVAMAVMVLVGGTAYLVWSGS